MVVGVEDFIDFMASKESHLTEDPKCSFMSRGGSRLL